MNIYLNKTRKGDKPAPLSKAGPQDVMAPAAPAQPDLEIDPREDRLFRALDDDNDQAVLASDLERTLAQIGLHRDDLRLNESVAAIRAAIAPDPAAEAERQKMDRARFCHAIRHNILLIERALQGRMVIPDFRGFSREIDEIHRRVRQNRDGKPADYIPQLDVSGDAADCFAVALCTIDGQRHSIGDAQHFFTVQSTSKPVSYALALEEHGPDFVHRFIGHEPSDVGFNELTLNKNQQPHNPMINAGAIMSSSLIKLSEKRALVDQGRVSGPDMRGWSGRRFDYVLGRWQALCGNVAPRFSTSTFLSERETADRNYALAYYMRENGAFPNGTELEDILEFYMQTCAIELNADMMSVVAATLANGGICPVTGDRVLQTETVRHVLSQMSGCGMYGFSGEFAFTIGLPAKSGVSGAIMVVVPNVMGFCVWSPRLDALGNSVRGIDFCRELVRRFNFHNFDDLTGSSTKKDPRLNPIQVRARQVNEMIWAASKGDLGAVQDQLRRGSKLDCADYDRRTPLHLAAAENQLQVVRYFIDEAARSTNPGLLNPRDRWGGTPLDDAHLHGHEEVIRLLRKAGATRGIPLRGSAPGPARSTAAHGYDLSKADELIWAASLGDLAAVRRLVAQGVPLELADYDRRTALHLAAAEGHVDVVRYCIAHGVPVNPKDRWGNTPLDDARRHGHDEVAELLADEGGQGTDTGDPAPPRLPDHRPNARPVRVISRRDSAPSG